MAFNILMTFQVDYNILASPGHKRVDLFFRQILDDFSLARQAFPEENDLTLVAEALQLSHGALNYDPRQLPGQIVGRISQVSQIISYEIFPPISRLFASNILAMILVIRILEIRAYPLKRCMGGGPIAATIVTSQLSRSLTHFSTPTLPGRAYFN